VLQSYLHHKQFYLCIIHCAFYDRLFTQFFRFSRTSLFNSNTNSVLAAAKGGYLLQIYTVAYILVQKIPIKQYHRIQTKDFQQEVKTFRV
jgi:hypothetical protein